MFRINSIYVKGAVKQINDNITDRRYIRVISRTEKQLRFLDGLAGGLFQLAIVAALVLGVTLASNPRGISHGQEEENHDPVKYEESRRVIEPRQEADTFSSVKP